MTKFIIHGAIRRLFLVIGIAGILTIMLNFVVLANDISFNDLLELPAETITHPESMIYMDIINTGNRLIAVGERGFIVFSDNDGRSWAQASVPTSVTLTAVYFPTAQHGWAVGHDGVILHSSDGGSSWNKQLDGKQLKEIMLTQITQKQDEFQNEEKTADESQKDALNCKIENCDFLLKDWRLLSEESGIFSSPLLDVWFLNEHEGIAIGAFGAIIETSDGGITWHGVNNIDNTDGYHFYGITKSNDSLFIAGEYGVLYRSDDYGKNWISLKSPSDGSFFGVLGSSGHCSVVVFDLEGHVYYSLNNGESWAKSDKPDGPAVFGGMYLNDNTLILVSKDGTLLKSSDNGKSFSAISIKMIGAVSIAKASDDRFFAVGMKGINQFEIK
jgi:photosystem II stability/assembly factor-like uncharacterized protein